MIKYTATMTTHKSQRFWKPAITSLMNAVGDREDIEIIILDDSPGFARIMNKPQWELQESDIPKDPRIEWKRFDFHLPLLDKEMLGINMAQGEYIALCNHNDIMHPKRFEYCDELLKTYDLAGAENNIFYNYSNGTTWKYPERRLRNHYKGMAGECYYPMLSDTNSAIPRSFLLRHPHDNGASLGLYPYGGAIISESPLWIHAALDGLTLGEFREIDKDAWSSCFDCVDSDSVFTYENLWNQMFEEVNVPLHPLLEGI